MSNAVVTLKKGEGRALKQGGAWIFDNEIASILGAYENGDIVLVRDFDGYPMGRGFINEHSKIRIRMMTRNIDQEIDEAFLRKRVQDAWEYRKKVTDTSSCRLIFGEADFLPGLVVVRDLRKSDKCYIKYVPYGRSVTGTRYRQNENDDHPPVGGGSGS